MKTKFFQTQYLPEYDLWNQLNKKRYLVSFFLEITARCNNRCRHCYINLPADDRQAIAAELTLEQIKKIADQAVSRGAFWCLITGGEPLLRKDFLDIYLYLKKKGLLVSVFTNACLITQQHIDIFKQYPPRDIEVTVYGVTKTVYERITGVSGSYEAFMGGLALLLNNKIKVRFKAMIMRSNIREFSEIADFCRTNTKDFFRFDSFLHLRYDGNPIKNLQIKQERLAIEEIIALEKADSDLFFRLKEKSSKFIRPEFSESNCNHLLSCQAGVSSFAVSYDGFFRLCHTLCHQDCVKDFKENTLEDLLDNFTLKVREFRSTRKEFLEKCKKCPITNLCMFCPAVAHLETGQLDMPVDYFCKLAHARGEILGYPASLRKGLAISHAQDAV